MTNVMRNALACAGVTGILLAGCASEKFVSEHTMPNMRFDRLKFHIGGWWFLKNVLDEEHVRDLRDCGLDYVYGIEANPPKMREVFDLFGKYGLIAMIGGWPGPTFETRGKLAETWPLEKLDGCAQEFRDNGYLDYPACQGAFTGDEPSAIDFPHLGKMVAREKELLPEILPYLNLFPSYATVYEDEGASAKSQLGTRSYKEYIDSYCSHIPLDYISFDFYVYAPPDEHLLPHLYKNYQIVADACRTTNRDFWFTPQVNSRRKDDPMSVAKLRFQAFSAMAFGCVNLNWACWCTGWWELNVLDREGKKSVQYDKLKKVNGEIRTLAPKYMRFRNVATEYVGFDSQPEALKLVEGKKAVSKVDFGSVRELRSPDDKALLVGCMVPRKGDSPVRALFVCAADDPFEKDPKVRSVRFKSAAKRIKAFGISGTVEVRKVSPGVYEFPIASSTAVLLVTD